MVFETEEGETPPQWKSPFSRWGEGHLSMMEGPPSTLEINMKK